MSRSAVPRRNAHPSGFNRHLLALLLICVCPLDPWGSTLAEGPSSGTERSSTEEAPIARFDAPRRVAWTTSRVLGSPDPPLPYRVRRVLPALHVQQPISVTHETGTDALLLVHQLWPWVGPGRILRVKDTASLDTTKQADSAKGHSGVLLSLDRTIYGIALHPEYKKNGYLFLGSNGPVTKDDKDIPGRRFRPGAAKTTRISRFTVDRAPPFHCDPASEVVLLEWPSNGHNGGDLAFGADGMLYITSGDGSADSDSDLAGQDLTRLLAKVLRIDVDHPEPGRNYGIPRDNPFQAGGARPETWAYGFRNPWRLHVDRHTGDVWVGNNGQDLWEQVYLVQRGANYGWSLFEGSHPFYPNRKQGPTPVSKPIVEHSHSEARSLTGGLVYAGPGLPELRGAYVYGDWSTGKIWGLRHDQGRVVWHRALADTTLQISGFGTDARGEMLIVDYGGGLYQLEPAPEQPDTATRFPTRLSETGLFASVKEGRPQPGLIPYSVNAALWSDGAEKERYIALPGKEQIEFRPTRGWDFPEGAVLVKTFSLRTDAADPASRRRIETRLLTRQQGKWQGYSYAWNDEQTDAELVPAAGLDRAFEIRNTSLNDGNPNQKWHYPSRTECLVCHSRAANFVLGLNVLQMNRRHDYGAAQENQLRVLERLEIFRVSSLHHFQALHEPWSRRLSEAAEHVPELAKFHSWWRTTVESIEDELRQHPRYVSFLPASPAYSPRLVDPYDASEDLTLRARSYLHANCAQCHVTAGGGNAQIELEFTTPLSKSHLINQLPFHQTFGIPDARIIVAGDPAASVLLHRLSRRGPGQMPPLATSKVDLAAVQLLRDWIATLKEETRREARQ